MGGIFVATNEKMNTPISAIKLHPNPNRYVQYFYISETELDKLETNSNILKIKTIDMENIQSIQELKKIVDESRLIAITKDEQGEKLLIHQRILEENPFLAKMLHKSFLPIVVEENHKYVIYKLGILYSSIDQDGYNQLCNNINSFVEEWFTQEEEDNFEIDDKYQEVFCWITKYFPALQKNEIAFLTYVEEMKKSLIMDQSLFKAAWLHHLTPWSINKEKMKDIIDHQKLAFVYAPPLETKDVFCYQKI